MTTSYFPTTEAARISWIIHYRDQIAVHGPTVGLSAEEIAATQGELDFYLWLHRDRYPASQADAKADTAYRAFMDTGTGTAAQQPPARTPIPDPPPLPLPGILTRVFAQVARIKNSLGFNDYVGNELGVIAVPDTTEHPWPDFSLSFEHGPNVQRVCISFTKYGHDGVWLESRVNNGEWLALGADNAKPHYDTRPLIDPALPEVREYRLRWWDKGEPNGEFSPVQKIIVGG
jgi:hypothetical protein